MSNLTFISTGKRKDLQTYEPISIEIEQGIVHTIATNVITNVDTTNELGGGIYNPKYKIFSRLDPEDFTNKTHRDIIKVCTKLGFKDLSIQKINELLPDLDPYYIESLKPIGNQDINQYIRHFIEGAVKRRIVELKSNMTYANRSDIEQSIIEQSQRISVDTYGIKDSIQRTKERIEFISKHGYGLQTHIPALNTLIKGFGAGQLIVIAGATSMGKTALGMNIAAHIADTHHTLFFSLEMTTEQLMIRLARAECGNDDTQLDSSIDNLSHKQLSIVDTSYLSIDEIEHISYNTSYKSSLGCIVIDYLQIMKMHKSIKLESLEDITARLKRLANELSLPIILLSQINRNVKDRVVKKPEMSDLRGSGSIEQDADAVLLIFRGSYYNPSKPSEKGKADIIVAKNRDGETGTVPCLFDAEHSIFSGAGSTLKSLEASTDNSNININDVRERLLKGASK